MNEPVIASIGRPPERHADRIVAEMVRWLKAESDRLLPRVEALLLAEGPPPARRADSNVSRSGSPRLPTCSSSAFGCNQVSAAGSVSSCRSWGVLAKSTEKPQVVLGGILIDGLGNYCAKPRYRHLFIVSHHALSRLAQRCDVRTTLDLHMALKAIGEAAIGCDGLLDGDFPPAGKRFQFPGGVAVLLRDADTDDLIVATVLEPKEEEE
jgi:hypothetical protein